MGGFVEYKEYQILSKVFLSLDIKDGSKSVIGSGGAIPREDDFWLSFIDFLAREGVERIKDFFNGLTIFFASFCKEGQVICKKLVRNFGSFSTYQNGGPVQEIHFMVNPSGKDLHTHDEQIMWDRVSLYYFSESLKELGFWPFDEDKDRRGWDVGHD